MTRKIWEGFTVEMLCDLSSQISVHKMERGRRQRNSMCKNGKLDEGRLLSYFK